MLQSGILLVISGPSGAGKGTLLNLLTKDIKSLELSISATTRKPREGEKDGVNYFFKTPEEFARMKQNDELIEWVEYCENYYGTPKKYVEDCVKSGKDVVLEIEVEGALSIKRKYPDCVLLFIVPPSFEELEKRIRGRGTENNKEIENRLERAKQEMQLAKNYDYIIVNDNLKKAVKQINCILVAEKLKVGRDIYTVG